MDNPYKQYQKTQVMTASREKILLMLYEGAIRFTKQAAAAMEQKKIAEKGKFISKSTAILAELMATLDFKAGGQLAVDLENLYVFMIDKLIEGNINNDPECLKHVERILMTLYGAWKDVIETPVRMVFRASACSRRPTVLMSRPRRMARRLPPSTRPSPRLPVPCLNPASSLPHSSRAARPAPLTKT